MIIKVRYELTNIGVDNSRGLDRVEKWEDHLYWTVAKKGTRYKGR